MLGKLVFKIELGCQHNLTCSQKSSKLVSQISQICFCMQEVQRPLVYEFGDFRLDAKGQRLYRRDTGEIVPLTPRAVLLLVTLVCSKGRLLTKEELLDRVWAGSTVEEGNLSQTIFVLRKALRDRTKQPGFIL